MAATKKILAAAALAAALVMMGFIATGTLWADGADKRPQQKKDNGKVLLYTDREAYSLGDSIRITVENRGNATLFLGSMCGLQVWLERRNGSAWDEFAIMPDGIAFHDKYGKTMNFQCGNPGQGEIAVQSAIAPGEIAQYQAESVQGPVYGITQGTFRVRFAAYSGCGGFNIKEDGALYARCPDSSTLFSDEFTVSEPAYPT